MEGESELDKLVNHIIRQDNESRKARVARVIKLRQILSEFHPMILMAYYGGMESGRLVIDAMRAYDSGIFIAAILCAHSSCERELAGYLADQPGRPPKSSERWGLGALLSHFIPQGILTQETVDNLRTLNSLRRGIYHYKEFPSEESLTAGISYDIHKGDYPEISDLPLAGSQEDPAALGIEKKLEHGSYQALRSVFLLRRDLLPFRPPTPEEVRRGMFFGIKQPPGERPGPEWKSPG